MFHRICWWADSVKLTRLGGVSQKNIAEIDIISVDYLSYPARTAGFS
jgi:hypothetical protein